MLDQHKTTKIAGPPGTGKTTTQLDIVDNLLNDGVSPGSIAFTTFTRAGAYEARDRACIKFNKQSDDFPYFRTLHSICYRKLGFPSLLSWKDWKIIGRMLSVSFSFQTQGTDEGSTKGTKGDHLRACHSLSKNRKQSLKDAYQEYPDRHIFNLSTLEAFSTCLTDFKLDQGKRDFNDILQDFVDERIALGIKFLIVDEAQDLSLLQWSVIELIGKEAEQIWVSGDDDQTIHEWAGASSDKLIDLSANTEVLGQSYRVPKEPYLISQSIVIRISRRIPKAYSPTNQSGTVVKTSLDRILPSEKRGSWFLLARNFQFFGLYEELCLRQGIAYQCKKDLRIRRGVFQAVKCWNMLLDGMSVTAKDANNIYSFLSCPTYVRKGYKKLLDEIPDHQEISLKDLVKNFGLEHAKPWSNQLDRLTAFERQYISNLLAKKSLDQQPEVLISTIHGVKGKEADNVVILPDMSWKTMQGFQTSPDQEHRVWYVGVTRTRNSLFLLHPTTKNFYDFD